MESRISASASRLQGQGFESRFNLSKNSDLSRHNKVAPLNILSLGVQAMSFCIGMLQKTVHKSFYLNSAKLSQHMEL